MTFPADLEEAYDYDFALSAYDNESGYFDGYSNIDSTSIASPALYPDEDFFLSSGQRDHPGAAFGTHAGYDARHYYHNYDNTGGLSRRQGVRPMNRAQNSAPWNAMPATGHSPPKSGTSRHGPAQMLKTNSRASTEYTVESAMSLDSHDSRYVLFGSFVHDHHASNGWLPLNYCTTLVDRALQHLSKLPSLFRSKMTKNAPFPPKVPSVVVV